MTAMRKKGTSTPHSHLFKLLELLRAHPKYNEIWKILQNVCAKNILYMASNKNGFMSYM